MGNYHTGIAVELWATVTVEINVDGKIKGADAESLELHTTEAEARAAVEKGLCSGEQAVALFALDGVYKIKSLVLSKVAVQHERTRSGRAREGS